MDARSDIFSFGSVLYEMLTGQKAFQGGSRAATIAAILKEEPVPLSGSALGIPRELERMIARCLRKDPAKRWQSIADLRTTLQEFKEDSDSGLTRSGAPGSGVPPALPAKSHKLAWSVAAVAVLAAAGVAVWAVRAKEAAPAEALHPVPLTSYPGTQTDPSFSPDGTQVAFSWDGEKEDNFDIYVKRVGPGPPLRLTSNLAVDRIPAWSPDGSSIAFLRTLGSGKNAVVLVPPLGGPERVLGESTSVSLGAVAEALAWTPDSKWLVIFDRPGWFSHDRDVNSISIGWTWAPMEARLMDRSRSPCHRAWIAVPTILRMARRSSLLRCAPATGSFGYATVTAPTPCN